MTSTADVLRPYDAVLVGSFGGPEGPEEVIPFLQRVTAGRSVPQERLDEVAQHYLARGGRSPINQLNRDLVAALIAELASRDIELPVVLGNRNSEPYFAQALGDLGESGATRVVTLLTSAYSSYSSCRQYRENLFDAVAEAGVAGLEVDKVRPYFSMPAMTAAWVRSVQAAIDSLGTLARPHLLFVTHSIPVAMNETSGPGDGDGDLYTDQHLRLMEAVRRQVRLGDGREPEAELVFCSRSGPPSVPWLEPDVGDRIRELASEGADSVVLAPIGFISDHMEVIEDLDTEAASVAASAGLACARAATPGSDPEFVAGLVDLLIDRAAEARGESVPPASAVGGDVRPSVCAPGCCPNLREARGALCGSD